MAGISPTPFRLLVLADQRDGRGHSQHEGRGQEAYYYSAATWIYCSRPGALSCRPTKEGHSCEGATACLSFRSSQRSSTKVYAVPFVLPDSNILLRGCEGWHVRHARFARSRMVLLDLWWTTLSSDVGFCEVLVACLYVSRNEK